MAPHKVGILAIADSVHNVVWLVTLILNMIGLQKMHRTDQGKALVSALAASFAIGFIHAVLFVAVAGLVFAALFAALL